MTVEFDIPDDLGHAINGLGVVAAEPLPRLVPSGPTGSWKLSTSDGSTFKGQMLWSVARCARARCIIGALGHVGAPHVVAWHGRAMVQAWVSGSQPDSASHAGRAGELLARIHSTDLPDCATGGERWQPNLDRTRQRVAVLVDANVLTRDEARRVHALLPGRDSYEADVVVAHGDLAPSNTIVVVTGATSAPSLRPIDNEGCDAAPAGWDLARTWYRWPMSPFERDTFGAAYAGVTGQSAVPDGFGRWLVAVLVDAIAYRLEARAGPDLPIAALQRHLRAAEPGATDVDVFRSSLDACQDGLP